MNPLEPIPTFYRGHRCRSRLEARWLVFLDALHIRYLYEPEGFRLPNGDCYLPDLWLPQVSMWGEVKPNDDERRVVLEGEAIRKAAALAMASGFPLVFFDGPPRDTNYWAIWPDQMDPVGWDWEDVVPSEGNNYHFSEHRFYASSGGVVLSHDWQSEDANHPAVFAARSARFERDR